VQPFGFARKDGAQFQPNGAYAGKWRISGNEICFSYVEGKRDAKWDCTEVKLRAGRVIWDDKTSAKLSEGTR